MDRLAAERKDHEKEKENLEKKMHYLETTYKNSRENFEQILKSAGASSGGGWYGALSSQFYNNQSHSQGLKCF